METSSKNLILGEAPESDEDEDMPQIPNTSKHAHADIVAGEASESDEEISNTPGTSKPRVPIITSDTTETHATNKPSPAVINTQYDSILHRKLREQNSRLQSACKDFLHGVTTRAVKSLSNSNQQLVRTQIMLQETASALKTCSHNMNVVNSKLSTSLANTVIPDISIQLPPPIPRSYPSP